MASHCTRRTWTDIVMVYTPTYTYPAIAVTCFSGVISLAPVFPEFSILFAPPTGRHFGLSNHNRYPFIVLAVLDSLSPVGASFAMVPYRLPLPAPQQTSLFMALVNQCRWSLIIRYQSIYPFGTGQNIRHAFVSFHYRHQR